MAERFTIDGLTYEVDFSGDAINFAIVGGANPVYESKPYDPFERVDDWGIEPRVTADIGVTRYPLRVYRQVLLRTYDWLGRTRPKAFSFSARSERRYWIYERVARHLAERFDYDLQIIDSGYLFFKLKPGAASQAPPPAAPITTPPANEFGYAVVCRAPVSCLVLRGSHGDLLQGERLLR